MGMGRLFWKFFAAFWIGLVTVAAVVSVGIWLVRWVDVFPVDRGDARRLHFMVEVTATLVATGDVAALRQVQRAWPEPAEVLPLALDEAGHDLLGRPLAPQAWQALRAAPEQLDVQQARTGLGLVRRVKAADGRVVTVFEPAAAVRAFVAKQERPPPFVVPVVGTLLASTLLGASLAWYFSHPIRTLRWALHRVAEGELDTRVAALMGRRRDELSELGTDFDHMARRMQLLVTAQQRLLHDVSHELRSPLARIQAAIEIARQQPDRLAAMQTRVERESVRLDVLVGELLTLARLETDGGAAAQDRFDVIELLAEICEDARFEAQASRRDLLSAASGEFWLEGQGELLYRAFENVIRNAVKFTREGTVVDVRAQVAGDRLTVVVSDHGPGVPDEALQQMFEPFRRVGEPRVDGFGLGLTIAKRAIESHGGRILARAVPGGGLAIEMTLTARSEADR